MSNSITEKVGKLLALAENASTEAEAEAALKKAQSLATTYSINLAVARAGKRAEERSEPTSESIRVGASGKHVAIDLINLFVEIARQQDVRVAISRSNDWVYAYGYQEDIDAAREIWSAVSVQMIASCERYLKRGEWRFEREYRSKRVPNPDYGGWWGEPKTIEHWDNYPVTKQSARRSFYTGFSNRIGSRLRESRIEAERAQEQEEVHFHSEDVPSPENGSQELSSMALVLQDKREKVADYYARESGAKGSWRGGRSGGSSASRRAGSDAGSRARMTASAGVGGNGRSIGRS